MLFKVSMARKSFDNVTCLFISFKNFFESFEKTINEDIKETINKKNMNLDILIRNKSNISQSELAKRVGIARSTVARMEKNLHSISLGTFTKLLEAMNYKLEIVGKEDSNEPG